MLRGLESIGSSDQGSCGKLKMHDRNRVTHSSGDESLGVGCRE